MSKKIDSSGTPGNLPISLHAQQPRLLSNMDGFSTRPRGL